MTNRLEPSAEGALSCCGHVVPLLVLVVLALAFFWEVVAQPAGVLYSKHSDIVAMHVPKKQFLVRHWQSDGELPLWCPYEFAGMPFVHDIQVAAFYPPQVVLYLCGEDGIPPALTWLVVLHVIVAGWCMYAYATSEGLSCGAAFLAACCYQFGGKWLAQMLLGGHYILIGLAWLPLVVLGLKLAIERRSWRWATLAGGAFGLLILGTQPQWTFYAGIFVALWSLEPALAYAGIWPRNKERRVVGGLARWLGFGVWTAAVGILLAAIQLWPTIEATLHGSRGAVGIESEGSLLKLILASLIRLFGPGVFQPGHGQPEWEFGGVIGMASASMLVMAPVVCGRRSWFRLGVVVVLLAFALGGGQLLQDLPGFRLFRLPSRMTIIAALPMSLLIGMAADELFRAREVDGNRFFLGITGIVMLAITAGFLARIDALATINEIGRESLADLSWNEVHRYWFIVIVTLPALLVLMALRLRRPHGAIWQSALIGVIVLDQIALTQPAVDVRDPEKLYAPSASVRFLAERNGDQTRVLDRDLDGWPASSPLSPAMALMHEIPTLRGYNPLDLVAYKRYINAIRFRDTTERPLLGIENFHVGNKPLLDMLGVRYLLQPSATNFQIEGKPPELEGQGWQRVFDDRDPQVYVHTFAGGVQQVGAYSVYENSAAMPRAFVVPSAKPLPGEYEIPRALRQTEFRTVVLLRDLAEEDAVDAEGELTAAKIVAYAPNEVRVRVEGSPPGWLVLTDPMFPGWQASIDGKPARIYEANTIFRAVRLPAGAGVVVFRFEPASYHAAKWVSRTALLAMLACGVWTLARRKN